MAANGEEIEVHINSSGGVVDVGSEIYTLLRSYNGNVKIKILGEACSAASVVAMAGHCEMSPTALMMIHCASTRASGNSADMAHASEMLNTVDEAICAAYTAKTGMTKEQVLNMMKKETWLNAEKALEYKLINGIMFTETNQNIKVAAEYGFELPTPEMMKKVKQIIDNQQPEKAAFYMQKTKMEFELLKMKGVTL